MTQFKFCYTFLKDTSAYILSIYTNAYDIYDVNHNIIDTNVHNKIIHSEICGRYRYKIELIRFIRCAVPTQNSLYMFNIYY